MRRTYEPLPLSEAALACIERTTRAHHGAQFAPPELADAVAALSRTYTRDRDQLARAGAQPGAALARIAFFLVRDLPKVFGPLDELLKAGRLPPRPTLRVLDLGAGLGATSFGLSRWLRLRGLPVAALEVVALERDPSSLQAFGSLARELSSLPDEFVPLALEARTADLQLASARVSGAFDLVLFGFVLNELFLEAPDAARAELRAQILIEASGRLAADGAMVVLEPALRATARELMRVRDVLVARAAAPFVIAPCLHTERCPMLRSERDWCHQELAYALPARLVEVARAASLRYEGLRYASLALASAPREAASARCLRVVSDRLESKGKLELFGCSAAGYRRLTRLTRETSERNLAFGAAQRGDVIEVDSAATRIQADTEVKLLR